MTRSIDLSVEVPGTPEEVWDAIATGHGITSWFVPAEVAADEGRITLDFGPYGKDTSQISEWDPPRRFVAGTSEFAAEWLVEAHEGGTCVVRLVNSGFSEDAEFDDQYDGTVHGWRMFLQNLRLHLSHFRGHVPQSHTFIGRLSEAKPAAWSRVCDALGVPGVLSGGDRLVTAGGAPALAGIVEQAYSTDAVSGYLLRVEDPVPGTAYVAAEREGDGARLAMFFYLYGEDARAEEEKWSVWLEERFV